MFFKVISQESKKFVPLTSEQTIEVTIPEIFWVLNVFIPSYYKLIGPFSTIEEANKCCAVLIDLYKKLLIEEIELYDLNNYIIYAQNNIHKEFMTNLLEDMDNDVIEKILEHIEKERRLKQEHIKEERRLKQEEKHIRTDTSLEP